MAETKTPDVKKMAAEGAAQAQKIVTDGAAQARVAMEKGMEQMTKGAEGVMKAAEEATEFGRGNMEAFTKAAQTWAVGTQDLARQVMALAQGLTDHALEGAKALAAVKSLNEAAEIQAEVRQGRDREGRGRVRQDAGSRRSSWPSRPWRRSRPA